jgi:integrase
MLTELACRHAAPRQTPYKLSDSKGLHLLVNPNGSKLWRLAYRFAGKQKTLALGAYPKVSLAEARQKRMAAKDALSLGFDPAIHREVPGEVTFEAVAREHHEIWKVGKDEAHVARVWGRMERDGLPVIGQRPVAGITPQEVLAMVRRVEGRGALDVSRRLKQKCSEVFAYAIATGRATVDPTLSIGKALKPRPRVQHMAMVGPKGLAPLVEAVWSYQGEDSTQAALRFTLLTAVRTSETRFARWEEIEGALWRIPARRMKMGREHLVPLSAQALEVLGPPRKTGYVFPGRAGFGVLSQTAMLMALRRLGFEGTQTVHGFRRLFSTVMNERGFNRDWIEMALAHVDGSVRGVYNSAEWLPERTRMMQAWADLVRPRDEYEDLIG